MNIYAMKKPKRINAVSISFFVVALVVGYVGWAFIPIYWPAFQLSGIMRGICNDAYRVKDNDLLIKNLLKEGRRTGLKLTEENFRLTRVPYSDEELNVLSAGKAPDYRAHLSARGKQCVLEMHYEDDFSLPLTSKTIHIPFDKTVTATLEQVKYDTMCTCVTVPDAEP